MSALVSCSSFIVTETLTEFLFNLSTLQRTSVWTDNNNPPLSSPPNYKLPSGSPTLTPNRITMPVAQILPVLGTFSLFAKWAHWANVSPYPPVRIHEVGCNWADFRENLFSRPTKICRKSPDVVKIGQKYRVLYINTWVRLYFYQYEMFCSPTAM